VRAEAQAGPAGNAAATVPAMALGFLRPLGPGLRGGGRRPGVILNTRSGEIHIRVGKGTSIASGAIVLGGVTIGENAIVAAGAVVTRDVPDGAVVAGVPARVIAGTQTRKPG
jgi:hypothetical protein